MLMNLPTAFESSSPVGANALGVPLLEWIALGFSALVALIFVGYLLRCYFQEFWRARRVQRRKQLARLTSSPPGADRQAIIEGCRRRRDSVTTPEVAGRLPN